MRFFCVISISLLLISISGYAGENREMNLVPMSIVWQTAPKREAQALGLHWVRLQCSWKGLEPSANRFNWKGIDKMCRIASNNNLGITLLIYTGQGWATYCNPEISNLNKKTHCPPRDLSDSWNEKYGYSKTYYDFIYYLVAHLRGVVNYFIIHNEVNSLRFWHGTAEQYLKLRKTAYKAVHDANPEAIVIDNGLAGGVWGLAVAKDWIDQDREEEAVTFVNKFFKRYKNFIPVKTKEEMLTRDNTGRREKERKRAIEFANAIFKEPAFDWFSFHYYEPVEALPEVIEWIKQQMKKNGYEKPIVISECGFVDQLGDSDDLAIQKKVAQDLIKMHLIAFSEGIYQLHWLPIQEGFKEDKIVGVKYKGLFAKNGQIRLAGGAWKFLNSLLDRPYYIVKKDEQAGTHIFIIEKGNQKIFVSWADKPTILVASYLGKENLQVRNLFGEIIQDSAITVKLDSEPKYLF